MFSSVFENRIKSARRFGLRRSRFSVPGPTGPLNTELAFYCVFNAALPQSSLDSFFFLFLPQHYAVLVKLLLLMYNAQVCRTKSNCVCLT